METQNVKQKAQKLIENLPENSSWDDLMYEIYVRQSIESGLSDSEAGRVISIEDEGVYRAMMEVKHETPLSLEEALTELEQE